MRIFLRLVEWLTATAAAAMVIWALWPYAGLSRLPLSGAVVALMALAVFLNLLHGRVASSTRAVSRSLAGSALDVAFAFAVAGAVFGADYLFYYYWPRVASVDCADSQGFVPCPTDWAAVFSIWIIPVAVLLFCVRRWGYSGSPPEPSPPT